MGATDGGTLTIDVRQEALSLDEVFGAVQHAGAGATVLFAGTVRNTNDGIDVVGLDYEAYVPMAVAEMRRIAGELLEADSSVRVAAIHRVGALQIGDIAVACAVSAPHRQQAFRVCEALINRIKESVPIWKREVGPDGPYWVGWTDAQGKPVGDPRGSQEF